jgi:hypothetical protein
MAAAAIDTGPPTAPPAGVVRCPLKGAFHGVIAAIGAPSLALLLDRRRAATLGLVVLARSVSRMCLSVVVVQRERPGQPLADVRPQLLQLVDELIAPCIPIHAPPPGRLGHDSPALEGLPRDEPFSPSMCSRSALRDLLFVKEERWAAAPQTRSAISRRTSPSNRGRDLRS